MKISQAAAESGFTVKAVRYHANIDRRLGELRRLKSEPAALAHAFDGDNRPVCPII